jgi:hypothetical protein
MAVSGMRSWIETSVLGLLHTLRQGLPELTTGEAASRPYTNGTEIKP